VPDLATRVNANIDDHVILSDASDDAIDARRGVPMRFFVVRLS
jgi:hypothetical protein